MQLPQVQAAGAFALLLSSAVLGYMGGMSLPPGVRQAVHPIVFAAAAPNVAAGWVGMVTGDGYWQVLSSYVTKVGCKRNNARFGVCLARIPFKIPLHWMVVCKPSLP